MDKWVDIYFYSGLMICFILFTVEIILNSIALDDFKYSFYFWLDIIATLSLIPDIIWLSEILNFLIGSGSYYDSVDVSPGTIKNAGQSIIDTSKIVKSLRLIRMIRIIKLYKYVSKTSEFKGSEGGEGEQVEEDDFNRKTDLSKLCRILSDMTTRKVIIIGVLLMLMLPLLTYSQLDFSGNYGLRELFWFGRSNWVDTSKDFYCEPGQSWITQDGWNQLTRQFVSHKDESESSGIGVLWIYAPDYTQNGLMNEIKTIPSVNTSGNYWEANKDCGGFEVDHSNCDLRISEMDIISYKPQLCESQTVQGCEQLVAYSRLNIK